MKLKYFVAIIKTQNLDEQDKHMKTPNFWSSLVSGKTPGWGKPVVRELLYFSSKLWKLQMQQDKISNQNYLIFHATKIHQLHSQVSSLKNVPHTTVLYGW